MGHGMEGILGEGVRHILVPGFATEGVEQDQLQNKSCTKINPPSKSFLFVCFYAYPNSFIKPPQGAYLFQASLRGDLIEVSAYLI